MSDTHAEQRQFHRLLLRSVLLPILMMILLTGILVWQIFHLLSAFQWVEHSDQAISQGHQAFKQLIDMETGKRGYLLSGDPLFLEPYEQANATYPAAFIALQQLVADNPAQRQRLDSIRSLQEQWSANARDQINLRRRRQNYSPASGTTKGKQLMDRLRGEFETFLQIEESVKQQRSAAVQTSTRSILASVLGLALILGALLALSNRRWLYALSGSYEQVLKATRDQSEQLQQQAAALQASEAHLKTTLRSIGDAVIATDAQGKVTFLNPVAERLTGWTPEEAEGKDLSDVFVIVNEETHQPVESPVEKVLREGVIVGLANHTTVIARDGTETPIDDTGAPIRDSEGNLNGVVLVFHDITGRKQAEQALRERETLYRTIGDAVPDFIWSCRADGAPIFVNKRWSDYTGVTLDKVSDMPGDVLYHPEDYSGLVQTWKRAVAAREPYEAEFRFRRHDGVYRWVIARAIPVKDEQGNIVQWIGTTTDIHERKQAEIERKRLENQLLQAQKLESVGRLAGGVAHDFNNMLTAILGFTELAIEECEPNVVVQQHLHNVTRAAERASNLTSQLLAFARRQVIEPRNLNLNDLILGLDKMVRRLIGENIELVILPQEDLFSVKVDPGQFEQILINLVVNARDAMPGGGKITIETHNAVLDEAYASNHEDVDPGEYVLLAISDTGTGMDEAIRLHIFEPFFTTKEKGRGTGLGLATVYGIVKQAGGHIWLYSEPGEGTTFKIYLPRTPERSDPLPSPLPAPHKTSGTEMLLLVEDEPAVRNLAAGILRSQGYRVLEAANGEEALRVVKGQETQIVLLITDVVMPRMSGKELSERLQAIHPDLKVLYSSGYTENTVVHHGVLDPGIAFLAKPFTPSQLARKVREVLDSGQ